MKKLFITLLLAALCAGSALAASDIKPGNLLQNCDFYTAGADPSVPEHWEIDGALAPDFTYDSGTLSFKNTSASGTVTPQYIYQDVALTSGTGRFYTVGLNIDAVDTFSVFKFKSLDEGNVTIQVQWLDSSYNVVKTEKTKGFLENNFINYPLTDNDYAFERKVYCPSDTNIACCRFCIYVEKGVYAREITVNQAWMYPDSLPKPYLAVSDIPDGAADIVATGNVVNGLNIGFEAVGDRVYFSDDPVFRIYPVMAPDKYSEDCSFTSANILNGKVRISGVFNTSAGSSRQPERYCLEMRCKNGGSEAVVVKDYFYYVPMFKDSDFGWRFNADKQFKTRNNTAGPLIGVGIDVDRDQGADDYSVFYYNGIAKYIKGLEAASADLIVAKANWGNNENVFFPWSAYAPGCRWIYDISDFATEKGLDYCDWFDIVNAARTNCSGLMGFVGSDRLNLGDLDLYSAYREQLRSSDRKTLVANRLPGVGDPAGSNADLTEAAVYSRNAGDAVILDLVPSNGSNWRDVDFPVNNNVINAARSFDRPVFALTKAMNPTPKHMLLLMQYARDKELAGLIFDVNPDNAVQARTVFPQIVWGNFVAAMFMKDFLNDAIGLIANFTGGSGDYLPAGVVFNINNDVVRIGGDSQIDNTHVNCFVNGNKECFLIVNTSMSDDYASKTAHVNLEGKAAGFVCDVKTFGIDGSVTTDQLDLDSPAAADVNGVSVFYIHKPEE